MAVVIDYYSHQFANQRYSLNKKLKKELLFPMQVLPFSITHGSGFDSVEAALEPYIIGKDSKLAKLRGTGNVQGLSRFMIATGDVLNSASKKAELFPKVKEELKKKRIKVLLRRNFPM